MKDIQVGMMKKSEKQLKRTCLLSSKKRLKYFIAFSIVLSLIEQVNAQISGHNLVEFQYGKLPHDTTSIATFYDRAVANLNYKSFRLSTTYEQFATTTKGSSYLGLSQFLIQYRSSPIKIKFGNFYDTIGRGLLLRAFEIPGAVLEDLSYRSRHYFHRDILGMSLSFQQNDFSTRFIYGKPLNYVFPPTQSSSNRRPDTIGALSIDYSIKQQVVGLAAMYHQNNEKDYWYAMTSGTGNLGNYISYYAEIAKNVSDFSIDDFSAQSSSAIYGGLNLFYNSFGLSTEYKNYNNILIGAGINEPPALVKEHSYKVLNRSTHVMQPINETGYQIELFYTFADLSTLTLNNTLAINDFGKEFRFSEYFAEYIFTLNEIHDVKIFADYATDPIKQEQNRISTGLYTDWKISKKSSIKTNYEFQTFKRLNEKFQNHVFVLGYALGSKFIFNIESEYSNDSFITDDDSKIWLGLSIRYRINDNNSVQIFAGERRGGPACNAGVCYEVLDFSGLEIRLNTRF